MLKEMQIALSDLDGYKLEVRNANSDNNLQLQQIQELIDKKVDILIISPFESAPITEIAETAYQAGIPTIITDRRILSDKYTCFIGGDNFQIGKNAGEYACKYLNSDSRILEIWGLPTSSPARERHSGFTEALKEKGICPKTDSIAGDWRYDSTKVRLQRLKATDKYTMIYSHNDMMAIAAREILGDSNPNITILGVDAVYGAGLEAVADGRINASFLYPTGSRELVKTSIQILNGDSVPKDIYLQTATIDKSTAQTMLFQADLIDNYQQSIVRKKNKIDGLTQHFLFLEYSLATFTFLLVALIISLITVFIYYKEVRKRNEELHEKNVKEEEQHKKLIELNAEIEKNAEHRMRFFTNISHEIRTPLTLIISPLDKIINTCTQASIKDDLELIRKNAKRLLREVNQMLDFRKEEENGLQMHIKTVELNSFVKEIKCYFDGMAREKNIDYQITGDTSSTIDIDADLMEKVLVNMLSNAFKHTPKGGKITVNIFEDNDKAGFSVTDTGKGIASDELPFIFDYFHTKTNASGTGIGLHLVKAYTEMNGGQIQVESTEGSGSKFSILISKSEKDVHAAPKGNYDINKTDELEIQQITTTPYNATILIVEDDEEIRNYLQRELSEIFTVMTSADGIEAVETISEQTVSLILSDVMMPNMNGFELCTTIKNDICYSHIPFILLTALSEDRQRIFGTYTGADEYISKPFSIDFVKIKIIHLLESQRKSREQLLKKIQDSGAFKSDNVPFESLDDLFLRKLLKQIDEVYTDSTYNVEKLSETMGMSRGHLYRKVKELTSVTPVDFLRNYRLKQACILISQKQLNVSEIAYTTGFSSPAYFSKCFKAVYGCTPTDFAE